MGFARVGQVLLLASFVSLGTGCATVISSLLGGAVCGDSDECRDQFIASGAQADSEMLASALGSTPESTEYLDDEYGGYPRVRTRGGGPVTRGGEEYESPAGGAYFHCVDGEGHHVVELVAPSALDARLLCATQLGVSPSAPDAASLCACRVRG